MSESVTFRLSTLTRLKALKPSDVSTSRFVELLIGEGLDIFCAFKTHRKITPKPGLNSTTPVTLPYRNMLLMHHPHDIALTDFTTHVIELALDSIEKGPRR
jgi:hypothetical protein